MTKNKKHGFALKSGEGTHIDFRGTKMDVKVLDMRPSLVRSYLVLLEKYHPELRPKAQQESSARPKGHLSLSPFVAPGSN